MLCRDFAGRSLAAAALLLAACERPLEPRNSLVHIRTGLAADLVSDHLAYRFCQWDWSTGDGICRLTVSNGDGTETYYGEGYHEPSWSPDAAKIAVDDRNDILVVTLADGSVANLTNSAAIDHSAVWSADGSRIAFVSDRDGQPELYVMNAADGSNVTRVTAGVGFKGSPSWFPDGLRLVFDCEVESGNLDVCAIGIDGTGFSRLTNTPGRDEDADVSPDGTRIVFSTGCYAQGSMDIAVMDADGANVTCLTTIGLAGEPEWSPAGGRIVFTKWFSGACDTYCEDYVMTMNADGSKVLRFADGSQAVWRPGAGDTPPPDEAPYAIIQYDCFDLSCSFDSHLSWDDHRIVSWVWDLGDGSAEVREPTFSYQYAAAGTYQVTLLVADGSGQTASTYLQVEVTAPLPPPPPPPPPPDQPPVARFTASCAGLTCAFQSNASSDDHAIVSRAWSFGDGSSAGDVVAPNHIYGAGGTYLVTLTVSDALGQTSTVTHSVTAVDQPPVARFTYSCVKSSCTFDGRSSSDDLGVVSYAWDFGGQGNANGAVVTVQLRGRSPVNVTLTVRDGVGQASSVTQSVAFK
jgi:PKD repeat protein